MRTVMSMDECVYISIIINKFKLTARLQKLRERYTDVDTNTRIPAMLDSALSVFQALISQKEHLKKKKIHVYSIRTASHTRTRQMYRVIATITCGVSHFIPLIPRRKMTLKLIWCTIAICCLSHHQQISSSIGFKGEQNIQVEEFIDYMENLVLNTTNKALMETCNIFQNFSQQIDAKLTKAIEPIISDYISKVNDALKYNYNYTEKRKLLQLFRYEGQELEKLRLIYSPEEPAFRIQLISQELINDMHNTTDVDNLYLEFMQKFQKASIALTNTLLVDSNEKEENYFELLMLLIDIENERNLKEKDKLYDEFIETFLFKSEQDRIETRELL
uniref:Uncharacterized protein n=1 Tax=Glossina brevipalpis TaxID=37001 RepID=A0A1A9WK64_9MUSC